ncbi:hypothetical protein SAMN06266982_1294 [Propioniciclava tarda]|nr:hypothetical protein SAMN06266982_1294 [Propioniciclava tarda]
MTIHPLHRIVAYGAALIIFAGFPTMAQASPSDPADPSRIQYVSAQTMAPVSAS